MNKYVVEKSHKELPLILEDFSTAVEMTCGFQSLVTDPGWDVIYICIFNVINNRIFFNK